MKDMYCELNGFVKQLDALMTYKEKLIDFNSKEKYKREEAFLMHLIDAKIGEKILDFGCGLGRTVWHLRFNGFDTFGYDVNNFRESDNENIFRSEFHFQFDTIYFMHSFAHVHAEKLFGTVFDTLLKSGGKVVIMTPNKHFVDAMQNADYVPDPTVVQHHTVEGLSKLFGSHGFKTELSGAYGEQCDGICERIFYIAKK